jgi:AraC-like DNA-binding protein
MDLIFAGMLDLPVGWTLATHQHRHHEIILVLSGSYAARTDGVQRSAQPGMVMINPAGQRHAPAALGTRPTRIGCISVAGRLQLPADPVPDRDGRLRAMLAWLGEAWSASDPFGMVEPLLGAVVAELERLNTMPSPRLEDAMRLALAGRLAEALDVAALAQAVDLTPSTFAHRFRAEVGVSPMRYLARMRLELATRLLAESGMNLGEVAAASGFADAFHLSHACRRILGVSPSQLRGKPIQAS